MTRSTLLCSLLLCISFMAHTQNNNNGLKHASANRWDNDYSIEVFFASNDYNFKKVPDMPNNPFSNIPGGNMKDFGADGFGVAFSKTLNGMARIEVSPAIYSTTNREQYHSYYTSPTTSSWQSRNYDLHGFCVPFSYISYFKIPKKRVSWYWSGNMEYTNLKLVTYDSYLQTTSSGGTSGSLQSHTFTEENISLLLGIGIDCKIKKRWYLFYDLRFGVTVIDPTFLGDNRIGIRFNIIK